MDNLLNLTPFSVVALPSMDNEGEELLLVVLAAHYRLPPAARRSIEPMSIAERQPPVVITDQYWGEPAESSLCYEGQSAYRKPGTDIHLLGHAWAPEGRPSLRASVGIQAGPWRCVAVVYGDRYWTDGLGGLRPSKPEPFERIPIRYEHCFGGRSGPAARQLMEASERNPVGRGLVVSRSEALGQRLPNFEDPHALVEGPADLPAPVGFGPMARHWLPRRGYGGTYDEAWVRTRAPLWPVDLDERFFCTAPASLCAVPRLKGGETVLVDGAHRDGKLAFVLPSPRLHVKFTLQSRRASARMVLDGVMVEPDEDRCTMTWRTTVRVGKGLAGLESIVVRELEPWEDVT